MHWKIAVSKDHDNNIINEETFNKLKCHRAPIVFIIKTSREINKLANVQNKNNL
jgi:hypothetical protein